MSGEGKEMMLERERAVERSEPINREALVMNPAVASVWFMGRKIVLPHLQWLILNRIALTPGMLVTHRQVMKAAMFQGDRARDRNVQLLQYRLQESLGLKPGGVNSFKPIIIVPGHGYIWQDPPVDLMYKEPEPLVERASPEVVAATPPGGLKGLSLVEEEVVQMARQDRRSMEIARVMGIPVPKVYSILSKARSLGHSTGPSHDQSSIPSSPQSQAPRRHP